MTQERSRLDALVEYQVLDTAPEPQFDDIVKAASLACGTPIALISLVDEARQWFKAKIGFEPTETSLSQSVCAHAVTERATLIIPDLTADARTAANTLVTAQDGIRFYAGAPLITEDEHVLGTLCVIDGSTRPGGLTSQQKAILELLAKQVVQQLDLRRELLQAKREEARYRTLFDALDAAYSVIEVKFDDSGRAVDYRFLEINAAFPAKTGLDDALGKWMRDLKPDHEQRWFDVYGHVAMTGQTVRFEEEAGALGRWYDVQAYRVGPPEKHQVGVLFRDLTEQRRSERDAKDSRARLELALSAANTIGTWSWDIRNNNVRSDPRFAEIFGVEPEKAATGVPIEEFFEGVAPEDRPALERRIQDAIATSEPFHAEYRVRQADASYRWIEAQGRCTYDEAGAPQTFPGLGIDITERKLELTRQAALIELGDRLRGMDEPVEMARVAAALLGETLGVARAGQARVDPDSETADVDIDWNAGGTASIVGRHHFREFGGFIDDLKRGQVVVIDDVASDHRTKDMAKAFDRIGTRSMVNVPLLERGVLRSLVLIHDNRPRSWSAAEIFFIKSIGDRTRSAIAEARARHEQRLLNEEMSHRLKNSLAMVMSIASQTWRGETDPSVFKAYEQRIMALSRAHDILLQQQWSSARMLTIINQALALHAEEERFAVSGDDLSLGPKTALSLALLMHELGTNGIKYGALSNESGKVTVSWRREGNGAEADFVLEWRETGGPTVNEPPRRGFGSRLIRIGLGTGQSEVRYEPSGVVATFRAPLSLVVQN